MQSKNTINQVLFYFALFVIVISGLKVASEIVVILLLSIFISSILSAFLNFLRDKNIPNVISYSILLLAFTGSVFLIVYLVNTSLLDFMKSLPVYEEKIKELTLASISLLDQYGIKVNKVEILKLLNFNSLFNFTTELVGNLGAILSKILLITIGVAFILSESKLFHKKIKLIFRNDNQKLVSFNLFSHNLQRYFTVKTFTSFLTGFFIYVALLFFEIKNPILWAFVAFLFNFIPVVGSIVASLPAIVISTVAGNYEATIWLIIIYLVINIAISNVIEPKFMGKELGLSPMVIFFSLIFWGWVLGIVGMFLAVPITMTLKIALEASDHTKHLGMLLSNISNIKSKLR